MIDDEADLTFMVKNRLQKNGLLVVTAVNGEEGILLAKTERPEVILLDIMMPGIDGYETLRRLKQSADTKLIDVIMMSAKVQLSDIDRALHEGARDYITKPIDAALLATKLKALSAV